MIKLKENMETDNLVFEEKLKDTFSNTLIFAIAWVLHELFDEADAMSFDEERLSNSFVKTKEDFFKEFEKRIDDFFQYEKEQENDDWEEFSEAYKEYIDNFSEVLNKIEELFFNNDVQDVEE